MTETRGWGRARSVASPSGKRNHNSAIEIAAPALSRPTQGQLAYFPPEPAAPKLSREIAMSLMSTGRGRDLQ